MRKLLLACAAGFFLQSFAVLATDVISFSLINGSNNKGIEGLDPIPDGATIDVSTLPNKRVNLRANPGKGAQSVVFTLTGTENKSNTVNRKPFTVFEMGPDWQPSLGAYTLEAKSYSESDGKGTAGAAGGIKFTVVRTGPELKEQPKRGVKEAGKLSENPP